MIPSFVRDLPRHGSAPALLFPNRPAITYSELADRVERQSSAFGSEKRLIALEARHSEHAIIAYLAALKGGHTVALLPPDDANARAAFNADFQPEVNFRKIDERWRTEVTDGGRGGIHPNLAVLLSTSGSTGRSRSVRLSGANLESNSSAIAEYLGLTDCDRGALILPLHYCYGLSVLNSHLTAGASIFLPGCSILEPDFVESLRRNGCTNLSGVPYSYELLEQIRFRDESVPDLRLMTVAGGRLSPHLVELYQAHLSRSGKQLFVMYGQTEATARIAFVPPHQLRGNTDKIGVAIPGGELALNDDEGQAIEECEKVGELVYRGPNMMMGYASSRADLSRGAELSELRTGDLAVRDGQGIFRIVGRLSRMSKIAGLRIGHDALEEALAGRGITAAVIGDDRAVTAVYASSHSQAEIRQMLVEVSGLTPLHVRARSVETLPRLSSGKIDYEQLRGDSADSSPPQHAQNVQEIFREAFFPQRVRDEDTFVSLGGDSLRYVQLTMSLEHVFGGLPANWEQRTIGDLSRVGQKTEGKSQALGTDLLIRALAATLVVVAHQTLWPVPGGAAAMVMLAGYSFARFQSRALFAGDYARVLKPLAAVLVPYYLIVSAYSLAWGEVPWASVLLLGNFGMADPVDHTMLPFLYWFVEAYAQMTLIWAGLSLVPAVRLFALSHPFGFGCAFLLAALAARFIGPGLWPLGGREIFTLPWILYLAGFGWCAFFADTRTRRLALLAAGAIVMPLAAYFGGNWIGSWIKYSLQFLCLSALLFAPRMRLPKSAILLILPISAASYHIYLFHRFVPELMLLPLQGRVSEVVFTLIAILGGIGLGLLAYRIQKALVRQLVRILGIGASSKPRRFTEILRSPAA